MITPVQVLYKQNPFRKLEERIDGLLLNTEYGDVCSVLLTCDEHKYIGAIKQLYSCWDIKVVEIGINNNIRIYLDFSAPG